MVTSLPNKLWRSWVSKIKTMLRSAVKCLVVVVVVRLILTTVYRTREVRVPEPGKASSILNLCLILQQIVVIPQATPQEVWEFMADFSNYKLLNPHLIQWHVLSDSAHKKKQVDNLLENCTLSFRLSFHLSNQPCDAGVCMAV